MRSISCWIGTLLLHANAWKQQDDPNGKISPGTRLISRLIQSALLLFLATGPGVAGTILFEGTFSADNQVALVDFTANISELITFQTYSYAGGSVNSTSVPAGGFAPTGFIFDGLGGVLIVSNGSCAQVGTDLTTGNCDDLYFQDTLGPGSYTFALPVYDNSPVGTSFADGFVQDSNPGFTCQETFNFGGSFCDVTTALGTSRSGDFTLSITGADSATLQSAVPEPGSMVLLLAGGAFMVLRRRLGFKFTAA